ncbi:MAG: outer membrane beta-barrel protein [Armatimonadota bacterium]|nr:porin [bacterium]MDW8321352.1 outer membrane beta-barrel protein [Armatimonadota bacterium]
MRRFALYVVCTLWVASALCVQGAPDVELSGLLDVYMGYNFNNPPSSANGTNQNVVRAFDQRSGSLTLSLLEVTLKRNPEPVGFTLTLTTGKTADLVHYNPGEDKFKLFQQAYITTSVGNWTVDVGKFVTALGAEVIESSANDNYSRSLPFVYAIPFYHTGIRASTSLGSGWGLQAMLVNGWDITEENNGKKSFHLALNYASDRLSFIQNILTGDEAIAPASGARTVWDTVLFYTMGADKVGVNFDYGEDKSVSAKWLGYAVYYRRALSKGRAIALRYSYLDDQDGFRTGVVQKLSEFTVTYEYPIGSSISRFEVRFDSSNQPFFLNDAGAATKKQQMTVVYSQVYRF